MEHLSLQIDSLSAHELDRWRALAGRAAEPNPFFEAEFATLAARHLEGDPELVVVADGDEWLACVPVVRRRRWRRFPAPWVIAWRHPYSYLGTPLVDRDRCRPACAALVDALATARGGLVALELVDPDGPVGQGLAAALDERGRPLMRLRTYQRATLARRAEPTYLDDTLSRSRRKELRRQGRRMSEAIGGTVEHPRRQLRRRRGRGLPGARVVGLEGARGHRDGIQPRSTRRSSARCARPGVPAAGSRCSRSAPPTAPRRCSAT